MINIVMKTGKMKTVDTIAEILFYTLIGLTIIAVFPFRPRLVWVIIPISFGCLGI